MSKELMPVVWNPPSWLNWYIPEKKKKKKHFWLMKSSKYAFSLT